MRLRRGFSSVLVTLGTPGEVEAFWMSPSRSRSHASSPGQYEKMQPVCSGHGTRSAWNTFVQSQIVTPLHRTRTDNSPSTTKRKQDAGRFQHSAVEGKFGAIQCSPDLTAAVCPWKLDESIAILSTHFSFEPLWSLLEWILTCQPDWRIVRHFVIHLVLLRTL